MGVLDLRTLTEQGIRFIKKENGVGGFRLIKYPRQVLLRLPDVLAHNLRDIDFVDLQVQLRRNDLGSHRLPGAWRAGEQDVQPPSEGQAVREAPLAIDQLTIFNLPADFPQLAQLLAGEHQHVPGIHRPDLRRQCLDFAAGLKITGLVQIPGCHFGPAGAIPDGNILCAGQRGPDLPVRETEAAAEISQLDLRRQPVVLAQSRPYL
ncbi:hypothetical protein D3C73_865960 [compost metagenome]